MKKIKYVLLIFFILIICGCNNKHYNDNKSLVVYFSNTGNTENIAKIISATNGSDIKEIIPEEKYTSDDLDYTNNNSRAYIEQNDSNVRPKIKNKINVEKYKTIYIGYPIWFGLEPKIILSFLDKYDLSNKKIILFATSSESDITNSMDDIKKYDSKLNIVDGKRFSSDTTKEAVLVWINSIKD